MHFFEKSLPQFFSIRTLILLILFIIIASITTKKIYDIRSAQASDIAFEETFDYEIPTSPSQSLLPKTFDYVVTHRGLGSGQEADNNAKALHFPSDHGDDCKAAMDPGPISAQNPILQHTTTTNHMGNATNPDNSFFICNNHMMSGMGDVDGYSVSTFWPKQEFDFFTGTGVVEWEVSLNTGARSWWEILITPRETMQLAAAKEWFPISETYPKNSIVLTWMDETRTINVYKDQPSPNGQIVAESDWRKWAEQIVKDDPAIADRRIRRKMTVSLQALVPGTSHGKITWSVAKPDGKMDSFSTDVPGGIPFTKGIVMFKTHAYTPEKDSNTHEYTYHWDSIRFTGPKLAPYENFEIPGVMQLSNNGSVPIGSTKTVMLHLPKVGHNPIFMGQTLAGQPGQILLSINGNPQIAIHPHTTAAKDTPCYFDGWRTFRISIDPSQLKVGENTFTWTVGPRPACGKNQWWWDGFSVKSAEIQFDGIVDGSQTPTTPPQLTILPTPTTLPTHTLTPTRIPTNILIPMIDTNPPIIGITNPTNGMKVNSKSTILLSANITDTSGVATVDFYVNNTLACSHVNAVSPYTCNYVVNGKSQTTYTIRVKAMDTAGNSSQKSVKMKVK